MFLEYGEGDGGDEDDSFNTPTETNSKLEFDLINTAIFSLLVSLSLSSL